MLALRICAVRKSDGKRQPMDLANRPMIIPRENLLRNTLQTESGAAAISSPRLVNFGSN
jgi:hypothetical protein